MYWYSGYGANCGGGDPLAFGSPAHPISFADASHEYSTRYLETAKFQFLAMEAIARDALAAFEDSHEDFDAVVHIIDEGIERLGFVRTYDINQNFYRVVSVEKFRQIEDSKKSVVAATSTVNTI